MSDFKKYLLFIFLVQLLYAGFPDPNGLTLQIPTYPQHGVPLTARLQAMGNISTVGQASYLTAISSPSSLANPNLDNAVAISVRKESTGTLQWMPGAFAYGRNIGAFGFALAYAGHSIDQGSETMLYMDEHGGTGSSALNFSFSDIHSTGYKHYLFTGIGYSINDSFHIGCSLGLIIGSLTKNSSLTHYETNTFTTVLATYSQTDIKQYNAFAGVISLSWDISDSISLGARFFTPISNAATVTSKIFDANASLVYQDPEPYLIENHTIGADAEGGIGISYKNRNSITLMSFEFHDNVYFGSQASWENWELRLGYEHQWKNHLLRFGAHTVKSYYDSGTIPIIADSNNEANSWGISLGLGINGILEENIDIALTFRKIDFTTTAYEIYALSLGSNF